jgi:undecaprenyl-diphosphatase
VVLTWWQAAVLGLVEGITEYLPISSTGHLILAKALLHLEHPETKTALDAYLVVIQGGAILAVALLYWPRLVQMVRGVLGRDPAGWHLVRNIAVAFIPAALIGVALHHAIEAHLFTAWPVLAALAAGGVWMIALGRRPTRSPDDMTSMSWRIALGIGLFQTLSLWPGTSRSMATIGGGMVLGLGTVEAAEFSFLLGLPILTAACGLELVKTLRHAEGPSMFQVLGVAPTLLGVVIATVSAALAVRWLVRFLTRHGLAPFGWYRLLLAATFAALLLAGIVQIG